MDSRGRGFKESNDMLKKHKEIWKKVYRQRSIKPMGGSLESSNPRILEPWCKGFTLIEIIVVIIILSIVSVISIKFLIDGMKIYTMTVNQKTLFDEGKLALERMCRDIRDGQNILYPAASGTGNYIRFTRTHATSQDTASELIRFQLALQPDGTYTVQKVKNDTGPPTADLANNIRNNLTDFIVTRDAGNEIQLYLKLSLASGENVTLQTRVYPKNLPKDATYKNFCQNWMEAYQ
jgi:prepilin-type N-terminal cleavage/methylation domain-containing protein